MESAELHSTVRQRLVNNLYAPDPSSQTSGHDLSDGKSPQGQGQQQKVPPSPYTVGNVCWMLAAMAMFYYTDFARVVLYDAQVKRPWLYCGAAALAVILSIAGYMICWLSWFKKIPSDEWESGRPYLIPVATAAALCVCVCMNVALWPVWSVATPVVLFVMFMGVIVFIAALPDI